MSKLSAGFGSGHVLALALARLSALCILGLVLLVNADVVSRTLLSAPLRGVTELASLSIPTILFLAAAHLLVTGRLIRADLLLARLDQHLPIIGHLLDLVFSLAAAALSGALAVASWPIFLRAFDSNEFMGVEGDFAFRVWPIKGIILSAAALLCFFALVRAGRRLRALSRALHSHPVRRADSVVAVLITAVFALPLVMLFAVDGRAEKGALAIVIMLLLVYAGMPVAFALMGAGFAGITALKGNVAIATDVLALVAGGAVSSYVFAAVPLFVLMGLIVGAAEIGGDSLHAAHWLLGRVKGGLGVATVVANAIFAAITGISIALAAIFSKVAVPPLVEQGFTARFATGLVAGSSVLGMLIPPSMLLIIYGIVAEVSIGHLFIAAVAPGLLLASAFAVAVVAIAWVRPRFAISDAHSVSAPPQITARQAARKSAPIAFLIVVVLGGIYGGVFTPTEAGAVGALAAFIAARMLHRIRLHAFVELFTEAATASASLLLLTVAASAFAVMLTLSGIPTFLGEYAAATGLGLTAYVMAYVCIVIILGMVLDSTSVVLIMVPLAVPTVTLLGGDLIWFGIITVIAVEISLLTPPLGLSVYAIKAALDDQTITLNDIFAGAVPFTLIMGAVTVVLVVFPAISVQLLK